MSNWIHINGVLKIQNMYGEFETNAIEQIFTTGLSKIKGSEGGLEIKVVPSSEGLTTSLSDDIEVRYLDCGYVIINGSLRDFDLEYDSEQEFVELFKDKLNEILLFLNRNYMIYDTVIVLDYFDKRELVEIVDEVVKE